MLPQTAERHRCKVQVCRQGTDTDTVSIDLWLFSWTSLDNTLLLYFIAPGPKHDNTTAVYSSGFSFLYTAQVHIPLKPQDVFTVRRSFSAAQQR